jgi:hypothetical protein
MDARPRGTAGEGHITVPGGRSKCYWPPSARPFRFARKAPFKWAPFEEDCVKSIARFCGNCSCGCPELFVDMSAPTERQVVITDDFGQKVEMSLDQFGSLVEAAKTGTLDDLVLVH